MARKPRDTLVTNEKAVAYLLASLHLGDEAPLGTASRVSAPGRDATVPFGPDAVRRMKVLLRTSPATALAAAPALLGTSPTVAQAATLLDDADMAFARA